MNSRFVGRVARRAQGFLESGEQIRTAMPAQGGISPWLQTVFFLAGAIGARFAFAAVGAAGAFDGLWIVLGAVVGALLANAFISRRVVLVTDRAVVVLEYGRFAVTVKPTRVLARLPLGTGIGPLSGIWARIELGGERLWVHKKWHRNAAAFTSAGLG
jgi:hypothetical protein